MNRIIYFSLTITAGLALAHSAFAVDENPNDKKLQKKVVVPGKGAPVKPVVHTRAVTPVVHQQVVNKGANPTFQKHVVTNKPVTPPGKPQFVQKNTGNIHNTTVNKTQVVAAGGGGGGKYTRANNYGGRWTNGANFHSDWNHGQEHDWNGHHYRWYDGGWLIVDGGFWPVPGGYQGGGSLMAGAQSQLANMGYYNGPVDGVAGPGTRQAIANFQNDNNLPATGHLNYPTQQALGLQ